MKLINRLKVDLNPSRISFLISFCWFLLFLIYEWPGIYSWDGLAYLNEYTNTVTSPFACLRQSESYLYACPLYLSAKLSGHLGWQLFMQCLVASSTVAVAAGYLFRKSNSYLISLSPLVLVMLFPIHAFLTVYTERDVLFSWLTLLSIILLFDFHDFQKKKSLVLLSILSAILPALRHEGILLWPIVLLLINTKFKTPTPLKKTFYLVSFISFLLIILTPEMTPVSLRTRAANSIIYTFHMDLNAFRFIDTVRKDPRREWETKIIEATWNLKEFPPFDLEGYDADALKPLTTKNLLSFHLYVVQLILTHPLDFLRFRGLVFAKMLFNYRIDVGDYDDPADSKKFSFYPKGIHSNKSFLYKFFSIIKDVDLSFSDSDRPLIVFMWHMPAGFILILILMLFSFFKKTRTLFLLNIYPIALWWAVYFTAPCPNPKYYYFSILLLIFIIPVIFVHFFMSHLKK